MSSVIDVFAGEGVGFETFIVVTDRLFVCLGPTSMVRKITPEKSDEFTEELMSTRRELQPGKHQPRVKDCAITTILVVLHKYILIGNTCRFRFSLRDDINSTTTKNLNDEIPYPSSCSSFVRIPYQAHSANLFLAAEGG